MLEHLSLKSKYNLSVLLVLTLLPVFPAFAEMSIIKLEVEPVVYNDIIVRYKWIMDVLFEEEMSGNCELKITFFDSAGSAVHGKSQIIMLDQGENHLSGHGVCKPALWKKITDYKAHISCF
jgi:hypothetical protein